MERLKFKIYNEESFMTLIDWFMNSESNDIEIEFEYDSIHIKYELLGEKIKDATVKMTLKTQEVQNRNLIV